MKVFLQVSLILMNCLYFSSCFGEGHGVVYGHKEGKRVPTFLKIEDIEKIKTKTHGDISTWLAIVSDLNKLNPKVHLIDTTHFSKLPTTYGIHQAYAQNMGLVRNAEDFITKMKGESRKRSLMAYTIYVFENEIVTEDGLRTNWVLQNRRYRFNDNEESFTNSLVKSEKAIRKSLGFLTSKPLFITYEKENSHRRPNLLTLQGRKDINALMRKGYHAITENEMVRASGKEVKPFIVHNNNKNNEVFGFLKTVESEEDILGLTPLHIAIFPSLPDRIPPVAGIVTLEDQTALSHINVLAINRGTLNIAVNQDNAQLINEIKKSVNNSYGLPVRLKVQNASIQIEKTKEENITIFQEELKKKVGKVEIPEMDFVTGLDVVKPKKEHGPKQIGAKAANYGKIERLLGKEIVLPGYSIGFQLYNEIVNQGNENSIQKQLINPLLEKNKNGAISPEEINSELEKIRQRIQNSTLPEKVIISLQQMANNKEYREVEKVRFRSSTNCEDLPRFNGAGLYLSEGIRTKHLKEAMTSDKSMKKLHEDLLLVISSLWLPRAFWEREYFSIDHSKAGIAVQINPSFTDEVANGVIIASKRENKIHYWVNTQSGEASVTNPQRGEVPESLKFSSSSNELEEFLNEFDSNDPNVQNLSNIGDVFINGKSGQVQTEKKKMLALLLKNTRVVLENLVDHQEKYGIDIEFKLMNVNGELKLFIKQARPINLDNSH